MKKMKTVIAITVCAVTAVILAVMSIPLINNFQAYKVKKELSDIPLPEQTQIVESISRAGKLSGNGNGMQYFGAILIRSDLSLEELKAYYSGYSKNERNGPFVEKQDSQKIDAVDAQTEFATCIDSQDCYIVYLWGDNDSAILDLDIRGH